MIGLPFSPDAQLGIKLPTFQISSQRRQYNRGTLNHQPETGTFQRFDHAGQQLRLANAGMIFHKDILHPLKQLPGSRNDHPLRTFDIDLQKINPFEPFQQEPDILRLNFHFSIRSDTAAIRMVALESQLPAEFGYRLIYKRHICQMEFRHITLQNFKNIRIRFIGINPAGRKQPFEIQYA